MMDRSEDPALSVIICVLEKLLLIYTGDKAGVCVCTEAEATLPMSISNKTDDGLRCMPYAIQQ